MATYSFRKRERMVSRRLIETLFTGSRSMAAFPLRAVYQIQERDPHDEPIQLLISVPKKRFKHAVDRNRVKRQVREAYRLHKQMLHDALPIDKRLLVAFVWISDKLMTTGEVERQVCSLLQRMVEFAASRSGQRSEKL